MSNTLNRARYIFFSFHNTSLSLTMFFQPRRVHADAGVGPVERPLRRPRPHPDPPVLLHYAQAHPRPHHPTHRLHPHRCLRLHHHS
jgi:hypothetical protein